MGNFVNTRKIFPDAQKPSGWQCHRATGVFGTLHRPSRLRRSGCHVLVHWSIGPYVHWTIGPLVHWSFGPLFHWSICPLVHWSIGPLDHWSIGPLVHWSIGSLVHLSIGPTPLVHWSNSIGPLVQLHWSIGPFVHWSITLWLSCNGEVEMINFHF